jgi:hypothetical protein
MRLLTNVSIHATAGGSIVFSVQDEQSRADFIQFTMLASQLAEIIMTRSVQLLTCDVEHLALLGATRELEERDLVIRKSRVQFTVDAGGTRQPSTETAAYIESVLLENRRDRAGWVAVADDFLHEGNYRPGLGDDVMVRVRFFRYMRDGKPLDVRGE